MIDIETNLLGRGKNRRLRDMLSFQDARRLWVRLHIDSICSPMIQLRAYYDLQKSSM
jgi:hypothetical protein